MTNDLFPKHDELANRELSIEAVAAGFGFGDIYHFVKGAIDAVLHQPISGTTGPVGGFIHGVRGIIRSL